LAHGYLLCGGKITTIDFPGAPINRGVKADRSASWERTKLGIVGGYSDDGIAGDSARLLVRLQPAAKGHGDELFEPPCGVSIHEGYLRQRHCNVIVDNARMPHGNRGYNFKGIVAISGFQGSLKYETAPFFLALDSLASTIGHNGGVLKSSVYESMDRWPGFLGLYATNDFETADGAIEAFNKRL
jgi:hypothetical protein